MTTLNYSRWKNNYKFNQYEYNLIYDIYNNIKHNSRIIFLIRHAERWLNISKEWGLNQNWIRQAKSLWKRLRWWIFSRTDSDFYWSTAYKRTHQTSYYVWYGRWYNLFHDDKKSFMKKWIQYDKIFSSIDIINPNYLTQDMWFKELNKKSVYMVNKLCELIEWHPFSFIVTHDCLLIPLITWVTEWNIKFTKKSWINYLAWVVIILNDTSKKWEIYPINTLKKKSMILID